MNIQANVQAFSRRIASLAFLAVGAGVVAGTPPSYTAEFITPGIAGANNAAAMNSAGDVIGTTTYARAWVSLAGAPAILLPLLPGMPYSFAYDIADNGVIVGSVNQGQYSWMGKAAAWMPNGAGGYDIVQYGTLPGHVSSSAAAVNNVGDVVGYSSNGTFRFPVLFTAPGGIQDLSSTGIFDPVSINDQRVLIDHSFTCKKLDLNTMTVQDLGTATDPTGGGTGYAASRGEAINEAGQIAGSVRLATSGNCDHQAARFTDGVGWQVFSMCGEFNSAWDINDLGDVVMRLNEAPYVRFEGIGTFLIEDLITPDVGHWFITNGYGLAINDSRQMAVPAHNSVTGESGIVLLTPIAVVGDIDGDGHVSVADLLAVIGAWGACPAPPSACLADLNADNVVDVTDLLILIGNWG